VINKFFFKKKFFYLLISIENFYNIYIIKMPLVANIQKALKPAVTKQILSLVS